MKHIKRLSIIVQVFLGLLILFAVISAILARINMDGQIRQFYYVVTTKMEEDLSNLAESVEASMNDNTWLLEYCHEHPERIRDKFETYEAKGITDLNDIIFNLVENTSAPIFEELTYSLVEGCTEEEKTDLAMVYYISMMQRLKLFFAPSSAEGIAFDKLVIVGIGEENKGELYCMLDYESALKETFSQEGKFFGKTGYWNAQQEGLLGDLQTKDLSYTPRKEILGTHSAKGECWGFHILFPREDRQFAIGIMEETEEMYDVYSSYTAILLVRIMILQIVIEVALLITLYIILIRPMRGIASFAGEYFQNHDNQRAVKQLLSLNTNKDLNTLGDDISNLMIGSEIYMRRKVKVVKEQQRIASELEFATKIQVGNLSTKFPDNSIFTLYATMMPAKDVGGDFYDFFQIDEDRYALVIADVSGKGVPAALFMMKAKLILQNVAMEGQSAEYTMKKANKLICQDNAKLMFVTVWFGILTLSTGRVCAVNAGHTSPVRRKADGSIELLKGSSDLFAGVVPDIPYQSDSFLLEKGDTLLLYTDGVIEAMDESKAMFRKERLLESLQKAGDLSPRELIEKVKADVDAFIGDAPQFDDLTMLCVKYHGG